MITNVKVFFRNNFPGLVNPKAINVWLLFITIEAITCFIYSIAKSPKSDTHYGTILQSTIFSIGVLLTIISLIYLNKTAVEIRNQTEASQTLAELTANLLKVELSRDTQSNLISGYLMVHVVRKDSGYYSVKVNAHINNQSVQPISRVTAKLYLNPRITHPTFVLFQQDIPISVAGPKEDRLVDITDSFHSPGFNFIQLKSTKEECERLANSIEIEYSIQLTFRGADGKWYVGNIQNSSFVETPENLATSMYETAFDNYVKKKLIP